MANIITPELFALIRADRIRECEIRTYWARKQDRASDNLADHFDIDDQIDVGAYCIDSGV